LIGLLRPKNKSAAAIENAIENARWEYLKKKHGL
jgi:hypothetical protein